MQELHAFNNGDGTFTVQVVGVFNGVPKVFQAQNAQIDMNEMVLDGVQDNPVFHFTVRQNGFAPQ